MEFDTVKGLYTIGWAAAFLCMLFSVWIARTFLLDNARLSTAMALFACAWALVLGSYGDPHASELANLARNIAAVLFIFIGGLLGAEARYREGNPVHKTGWPEKLAMSLLFFIAVPSAITFPGPVAQAMQQLFHAPPKPMQYQIERVIGDILNLAGFLSLALGARAISKGRLYIILVVILVFYLIVSEIRTVDLLSTPAWHPMGAFSIWTLAGAKIALTITLGIMIARYAHAEVAPAKTLTLA